MKGTDVTGTDVTGTDERAAGPKGPAASHPISGTCYWGGTQSPLLPAPRGAATNEVCSITTRK